MIFYALICASLLAITVGYCAMFKRRFEECVGLGVLTDIIIMFIAGYLGHLNLGAIAVAVISAISLIAGICICLSRGEFRELATSYFSLAFFIFLGGMVLVYFTCKDLTLTGSDAATSLIKLIASNESIEKVATADFAKIGWAPGYALFCYMFTALSGSLTDGYVIGGATIFVLAFILPVINRMKWKAIVPGIFSAAVMLLIPWVISTECLNTVNADLACGLVFGFMLIAVLDREYSGYGFVSLGLGSCALFLMRPGAELLAAVALLVVVVDVIACGWKKMVPMFTSARWFSIVIYAVLTGAGFLGWWVYAADHGITRLYDCLYITEARAANLAGNVTTVAQYLAKGQIGGISYDWWIVILAVLGCAAALLQKDFWDRIHTGVRAMAVIVGFAVFTFGLALAFTYIFPVDYDYTGMLQGYLSAYILGMLLFMVTTVLNSIMDRFRTYWRLLVIAVLVLMLLIAPYNEAFKVMFAGVKDIIELVKIH